MSAPTDIHVLTPGVRRQRPFPKMALSIIVSTSALCILLGKPSATVDMTLKLAAALAGCSLAAWLETWLYDRAVGRVAALRLLLAGAMPLMSVTLVLMFTMPLGLLAQEIGDDGALLTAGISGAFWMGCAALGTLIIVVIDVLISFAVPDFRSRVQLAVMGLLVTMTSFVGVVTWVGQSMRDGVKRYTPEIQQRAALEGWSIDLGEGPRTIEELLATLGESDTANLFALTYFVSAALLALPALLSACGKLADITMERLHPLQLAFSEVARGDLNVRVEEAGSRDFVALSRGFNHMAEAQSRAFAQIQSLNTNLEKQVEARTRELKDALDELTVAQAHLVESEKQAMLGRLVAGILHEVNTPLGALRSSANTMDRSSLKLERYLEQQDSSDKEVKRAMRAVAANRKLCDVLAQSSERIEQLMGSLSQFVSLDTAEYKQHNLKEGLNSALTLLSKRTESGVNISCDVPEDTPTVRCYPAKLNQVFFNLLENALTALEEQEDAKIQISVSHDETQTTVKIEDNGPGIPEEKRADLFEFGFTKKDGGRMGLRLGLPSSKRWVEELGGALAVTSAPGEGTTVEIRLPKEAKA